MGYDTKLAEETLSRAHGRRDASTHYEARAASVKKLEEALAEAAKTAGYDTERKKCLGVICHAGRGEVRIDRNGDQITFYGSDRPGALPMAPVRADKLLEFDAVAGIFVGKDGRNAVQVLAEKVSDMIDAQWEHIRAKRNE